jgi:hypothetical protein
MSRFKKALGKVSKAVTKGATPFLGAQGGRLAGTFAAAGLGGQFLGATGAFAGLQAGSREAARQSMATLGPEPEPIQFGATTTPTGTAPQPISFEPLTETQMAEAGEHLEYLQREKRELERELLEVSTKSPGRDISAADTLLSNLTAEIQAVQQRIGITQALSPVGGAATDTTTPVDIGSLAQQLIDFERQKFEAGEPYREAALEGIAGLRKEAAAPIGASPQFQEALQRGVTGIQTALAPFGLQESTTGAEAVGGFTTGLLAQAQAGKAQQQATLAGLGQLAPQAQFGVGATLAGQVGQQQLSRLGLGLQAQQQLQSFMLGQQGLALQEKLGIGQLELNQLLGLEGLKLERAAFQSDEEYAQYQQAIDLLAAGGTVAAGVA